ncbi:DUF3987 domain-containing protein [Planctomycetota bacterium]|nr:DUF3987 domain-containing protein [Planctomycetota bacterium]
MDPSNDNDRPGKDGHLNNNNANRDYNPDDFICKGYRPSKIHLYCSRDGLVVGAVVRYEAGTLGKSKQFHQYRYEKGKFVAGLGGGALPLYNLPQLAYQSDDKVIWVEGEKCADALKELGFLSSTTPGGAMGFNAWHEKNPDALKMFVARSVVLMTDNDEAGSEYTIAVAEALQNVGATVLTPRKLPYADMGEKADIADFIDAGGTTENIAEAIANLSLVAPIYEETPEPLCPVCDRDDYLRTTPMGSLPGLLPDYVRSVADNYCVDPAMPFAMVLAVAASAIGQAANIRIRDGWVEKSHLWVGVIAPPGAKKSPLLKEVCKPMYDYNALLVAAHNDRITAWDESCVGIKNANDRPKRPRCKQSIVSDATIEALGLVLEVSPRVLSCLDELKGLFDSMGCYKAKGGHDRQSWLSLHNGAPVVINRKSQRNGDPLIIPNPRLGVLGCTTPSSAARLHLPETGDGLTDRFFFVPVQMVEQLWDVPNLNQAALQDWHQRIKSLCGLPVPAQGKRIREIPLTTDAAAVFGDWYIQIDAEAAPGFMQGVVSKQAGHCARISLTLALLTDPDAEYIEEHDVANAIRITEWLVAKTFQARQAMFSDADAGTVLSDRAKRVKEWLERQGRRATTSQLIAAKVAKNKDEVISACNELELNKLGVWTTRKTSSGRMVDEFKLL